MGFLSLTLYICLYMQFLIPSYARAASYMEVALKPICYAREPISAQCATHLLQSCAYRAMSSRAETVSRQTCSLKFLSYRNPYGWQERAYICIVVCVCMYVWEPILSLQRRSGSLYVCRCLSGTLDV